MTTYSNVVWTPSRGQLFETPWTVARQAPPSMGFSRQEHWSGLHVLLQGIFPAQGLTPGLLCCRQILYRLSYERSPYSNRQANYSRAITMIVRKIKHLKIYQGLPWWSSRKESALQCRGAGSIPD